MGIRIDVVDPESERDAVDIAALYTVWGHEVHGPDEPAYPAAAVPHEILKIGRPDIDYTAFLARDGDRAVGLATIDIRSGWGNEHMAYTEDLYVAPGNRRRGAGRALLDEVVSVARDRGRTLIMSGYRQGDPAGEAFAAHVGASPGQVERQNRATVAELDRALMESWLQPVDGYSLVPIDDRIPDDLIDDFVRLMNAMNDAPRSDALEPWQNSAERHRAAEAAHEVAGIRQWTVCARHDTTGELAGYTELVLGPHTPWIVEQGDTAVAAPHRGHGLGRLVKAANAIRILDELPDARFVETWNDGTNRWMLAINDAMGFRPVASWVEAELHLPD